jgi:hypothetical protein
LLDSTRNLDKTLAPDWKDAPLDATWPAPDGALRRQVEASAGLVAERFALCQALPLEEVDALATGLGRSGYRLLQLRPYPAGPRVRAAALWVRDGQRVRWGQGLTAAEVNKQDAAWRAQGLVPLDVTGYLVRAADGPAGERYAVLWGLKEAGMEDARLYVGAAGRAKQQAAAAELQKQGFRQRTQGYVGVGKDVRFSGIVTSSSTAPAPTGRWST